MEHGDEDTTADDKRDDQKEDDGDRAGDHEQQEDDGADDGLGDDEDDGEGDAETDTGTPDGDGAVDAGAVIDKVKAALSPSKWLESYRSRVDTVQSAFVTLMLSGTVVIPDYNLVGPMVAFANSAANILSELTAFREPMYFNENLAHAEARLVPALDRMTRAQQLAAWGRRRLDNCFEGMSVEALVREALLFGAIRRAAAWGIADREALDDFEADGDAESIDPRAHPPKGFFSHVNGRNVGEYERESVWFKHWFNPDGSARPEAKYPGLASDAAMATVPPEPPRDLERPTSESAPVLPAEVSTAAGLALTPVAAPYLDAFVCARNGVRDSVVRLAIVTREIEERALFRQYGLPDMKSFFERYLSVSTHEERKRLRALGRILAKHMPKLCARELDLMLGTGGGSRDTPPLPTPSTVLRLPRVLPYVDNALRADLIASVERGDATVRDLEELIQMGKEAKRAAAASVVSNTAAVATTPTFGPPPGTPGLLRTAAAPERPIVVPSTPSAGAPAEVCTAPGTTPPIVPANSTLDVHERLIGAIRALRSEVINASGDGLTETESAAAEAALHQAEQALLTPRARASKAGRKEPPPVARKLPVLGNPRPAEIVRGSWFVDFPGGEGKNNCPSFAYLRAELGCAFACEYCYLERQRFRKPKGAEINPDVDTLYKEVEKFLVKPGEQAVILGEVSDPWGWAPTHELVRERNRRLVRMFSAQHRHTLVFLTKAARVNEFVDDLKPSAAVVFSWSVNARGVAARYERGAPSPDRRLLEAMTLKRSGWRVRIRVDPMIPIPGWEREYDELADRLVHLAPEQVTSGSWRPKQRDQMLKTVEPAIREMLDRGPDGRYRLRNRLEMYRRLWSKLRGHVRELALCKEEFDVQQELYSMFGVERQACNCLGSAAPIVRSANPSD